MSADAAAAAVAATLMAAVGGWMIYTSVGPPGIQSLPRTENRAGLSRLLRGLVSGLDPRSPRVGGPRSNLTVRVGGVRSAEVLAAVIIVGAAGAALAWLLFGGVIPALFAAVFAGSFPVAAQGRRIQARLDSAIEEWPRLLEEIRLRTGSLGRSIPQALFEAGRSGPADWRPAFVAAEREWLLTVDFDRTVAVLKQGLADPAADSVLETLLMAHEIGGTDLDSKLAELIEDRAAELQSRRDANSRLAGVRFARRFVLLVPLGMALAGLTIGTGRRAYQSAGGQVAVVVGLAAVAVCWWWSGRLMRLPGRPRVFR